LDEDENAIAERFPGNVEMEMEGGVVECVWDFMIIVYGLVDACVL